ncbi:16S rRNA pseudouridine(516) synthase RsuA [Aliidiomarina maris]|uniref:Pseudouridine synthase n=1 Tax=Aliidiomarina maris TaxID=531312 RepID=A0A327WMY0_9GAMM|nr:16S rRNA pseudouridine(516) synthase RsuA [Aliidiomarina maris]MBA3987835.1 16S rRNA pseudouridine(516) synthase RsuA [Idiomarina sp.]MCL5050244.1 16S rRNA pseudouridine(516) synthase RsuA [Bacillota bacterium]RAJ92945.1 ribosomal small subunit pseudouridine synthase A [Aliidiomarina maris]RUO20108.1 16S rRNA pseudouridine(516) synthase RsuA [Aliidiomarina maris]
MRLDKFVCDSTGLSRKEAGRVIRADEIEINGQLCRKAATPVKPDDEVTWLGNTLAIIGPRYLMLHKPAGVISGLGDPVHPSVFSLLDEPKIDSIHCVGRLDVDTTGLLLLTDDGQWSHRITSPKHECAKTYIATLADAVDAAEAQQLATEFSQGVMLHGEEKPTKPAEFELIDANTAKLVIHEGRYHQVKRMFAAVGHKVVALHRSQIGGLALDDDLLPGEYRALTAQEVELLGG